MRMIDAPKAGGGTLRLAVEDLAAPGPETGPPVVLVHGFASSRRTNWRAPGWYAAFAAAGRRVIAFDHRGHGESDVSYDPADYDEALMAGDVRRAMDACGVATADVFGYSMGGFVTLRLLAGDPVRVRRAVVGGIGETYLTGLRVDGVAEALLAEDPSSVRDAGALGFRAFAQRQGQDLRALAACWRRPAPRLDAAALARIATPTLVVCGADDGISGPPEPLAAALGAGQAGVVPRRDHMTAVGDRGTKALVEAFLAG